MNAYVSRLLFSFGTFLAFTTLAPTAQAAHLDVIGLYNFQSSNAADVSGNGNNGTILGNSVTFIENGRGNGNTVASFSAVRGRSGIETSVDINEGSIPNMTMGGWFNFSPNAASLAKLMSHDNGGYDRTLGVDTRGGGGFAAFNGGGVTSGVPRINNEWVHLAVAYTATSTNLFLNGKLRATGGSFFGPQDSTFNLHLGTNPGFNEDFVGLMDDVFVVGAALGTTDLTEIMDTGIEAHISPVPVPAALPLLATAFGGFGLLSWRRNRKKAA